MFRVSFRLPLLESAVVVKNLKERFTATQGVRERIGNRPQIYITVSWPDSCKLKLTWTDASAGVNPRTSM